MSTAAASSPSPGVGADAPVRVEVRGLTLAHGATVVQRDLTFDIRAGEVLAITGGSGSGKSTLLRALIGLLTPASGTVLYEGVDLHHAAPSDVAAVRQRFGVMFQSGALWSSMSVIENLMLPLELFRDLAPAQRRERARAALRSVDLAEAENADPSDLSGGMRKRVALARALMLEPPILYLDEPAAGLDPINTARLNDLVLKLADGGRTVVMVTHDIPSVLRVADRMMFLDADEKTMTALDAPSVLAEHGPPTVREFLDAARAAPRHAVAGTGA